MGSLFRSIEWQYRRLTRRMRSLPDFLIIGAQKAGTTSLYSYLAEHPQLVPSFKKEVHFFDGGMRADTDDYERGEAWYRAHFPIQHGARCKTYEASPLYLFNPLAAGRIAQLLPRAKLIVLLRNPAERAISHYFHEIRRGREQLPIGRALELEDRRLAACWKEADYKNPAFRNQSYKSRGLYAEQLERYSEYFADEQILVLNSEEFFRDTGRTLRRVLEFVGVDPTFTASELGPQNVASNRADVGADVYEQLNEYFAEPNQRLYRLIGRTYDWG